MELQQNPCLLTSSGGGLVPLHQVSNNDPESREGNSEGSQNELNAESTPVEAARAAAAQAAENAGGNLSGVRKMILNPAEEALDSARQTAEVIIKDTINALQRTKQRLIEILPHRRAANGTTSVSQAATDLGKTVGDAAQTTIAKVRPDTSGDKMQDENAAKESSSTPASASVVSRPAMGFVDSLKRAPASVLARTARFTRSRM